ncbi:MAG TPA: hypothetical protein VG798_08645, partial [Rhizomicrobium sp.]|nr:hypothetical protein [Rhizomicrobium sp.]
MVGAQVCPDHRLALGIYAGNIVRPLQGSGARRGRRGGLRGQGRNPGQKSGENAADYKVALHVISLRLLHCNKANYCVTPSTGPIINPSHKKKAKNR